MQTPKKNSFKAFQTEEAARIQRLRTLADAVRARFGITAPKYVPEFDVEGIAAALGIEVIERPLSSADGRLVRGPAGARLVLNSNLLNLNKRRFAAAHELGHFLQEDAASQLHVCLDVSQHTLYATDPSEKDANTFAAEFLMPADWCTPLISGKRPSFQIVEKVRELCRTTLTAAARRVVTLSRDPCALVVSKEGKIAWHVRPSDSFYHRVLPVGTPLSKGSMAYDLHIGKASGTTRISQMDASDWLVDENLAQDAMVYEQSCLIEPYGILSIVYINDELRGWDR